MINEKIEKAFNRQITEEIDSMYLYLSMSAWFESINFTGMASWMNIQAKEEWAHAMKFYGNIIERGGRVKFDKIDAPKHEWSSPLDAFENAYKHECHISKCIDDLYKLAEDEGDRPAQVFLNWFIEEQVEEEASTDAVVQKLKMVKDSTNGLFMLDKALSQRADGK
mgnify:CR=1 FL=1